MASSVIGALRVNLGLDSAEFQNGAKKANNSLNVMRRQFLAVAGVASAMGAAVGAAALAGARDIDSTAKAARRLGASVGGFEAVKLSAEEAGVPVSALTDNLQNIDRELAKGGKGATQALAQLGLTAQGLSSLDSDEKIALIADRVKDLGLSSGQATALLQSLGVRSREMVLLLQGGGDAIRQARKDVEQYGLALSGPTVAAIEQANDRIGRLSLVARVFGQQMAIAVVPALGALAVAITDSLREGGALRAGIEAIASVTRGWVEIISGAVAGLASLADFIGGPTVAAVAALSAALLILRGRMILTGIGALIVGAGTLADFLTRLKEATGSWGEALSALGDVAAGVWQGIVTSASAIAPGLGAIWQDIRAGFFGLLENLTLAWSRFLGGLGSDLSGISVLGVNPFEGIAQSLLDASGAAVSEFTEFQSSAQGAANAAARLREANARLRKEGFDAAREALARLSEMLNKGRQPTSAAADEARRLAGALDDLGEGGKAGGAADGLKDVGKAAGDLERQSEQTADSFAGLFVGILDGSQKATEALRQMGLNLLKSGLSGLLQSSGLFGSGGALAGIGSIFAGAFDSGGRIGAGQFGIVGERGPEIVTGPASVTSRVDTARMMGGGGPVSGLTTIRLIAPTGFSAEQVSQARGISVQVVSAGLSEYDRSTLPGSVDRINQDPRRRG